MNTSEQINEIAAALAKAQAVIKNPAKDKKNPHFKSNYADLASGLEVIRPALSAHGVAFLQIPELSDDGVILRTRLAHTSGQWIEGTYPVSKFATHQQMGAALTYAKRQALFAMVGVCGTDDDMDGNDAGEVETETRAPAKAAPAKAAPAPAPAPAVLSAKESKQLKATMLMSLKLVASDDHMNAWADANRDNARILTKEDRDEITTAVVEKKKELIENGIQNAIAAE